jgi:glutamyl-tRNA reductase
MGIYKDNLFLIGISFKTAPVEIREKFSFTSETLTSVLRSIKEMSGIRECLVLSTCNRTEIYAVAGDSVGEARRNIENCMLNISGIHKSFLSYFYFLNGIEVVEHLFRVICGFDSMIFGETQIFGQVKSAFSTASDNKCTGPLVNRLFHQAFQVSKQVKTQCTFGNEGVISASSAAVALARKTYGSLYNRTVLLVGAGKMGRMCSRLLKDSGIKKLYLTNRTRERADTLVEELSAEAIPFDKMDEMFGKVDIIITSASTSTPLITRSSLIEGIGNRNGAVLTLIDLGVPRNVDPEVAAMENVILYNIDNLKDVGGEKINSGNAEVKKAREIIKLRVDEYDTWLGEREILPELLTLRGKCENIRTEELEKVKNKVSAEIYDTVDLVTRRIVRKILHNPTVTLRASESGENRNRLAESINELFSKTYERSNRKIFHEDSLHISA